MVVVNVHVETTAFFCRTTYVATLIKFVDLLKCYTVGIFDVIISYVILTKSLTTFGCTLFETVLTRPVRVTRLLDYIVFRKGFLDIAFTTDFHLNKVT
jgi:hypothetical protein